MKRNSIIFAVAAATVALTACTAKEEKKVVKEELPIVEVQTVQLEEVPQVAEYTATVEAFKTNNIASATGNRIKRILVDVGSHVRAGQSLVILDDVSIDQQRMAIDQQRIADGSLTTARQPLKDVWQFIIDDFTMATKAPSKNDEGRATSYAGWTMLGKAYMSAPEETGLRDFAKAKECFEKVMDGTYSLLPDYNDLWDYTKDAKSEVIFTNTFSCARGYANQVQFQIGSRAAQNWFSDACYFAGYDHSVPTVHAYETIENGGIWEKGDTRKDASLRYDFSYNGVQPDLSSLTWEGLSEEDHDELKPHIKKYEDFRTDAASGLEVNNMWLSGKNIPVLRYADVLLCYAECLNELGQTSQAETYVNQVRTRAFGGTLPTEARWNGLSQTDFREQMQDERIRELFGENWRRYDLIRTGQFLPRLKKYNKWAAQSVAAGTFKDYLQLWPIPLTELNQNTDMRIDGKFDQNEGY